MNEIENGNIAIKYLEEKLFYIKNRKLIISDGDETISLNDTSKFFFFNNGLEDLWLKNRSIFKEKGRNYESYSEIANLYTKIPYNKYKKFCQNIFEDIEIREYWKNVIETEYQIIIVTSGLKYLWEYIVNKNRWKSVIVIGGNNYNEQKFIMTPQLKGKVIEILKRNNNKILAFGDSRVDVEMLKKSDIGTIVINERLSPGLLEELQEKDNICELKEKYTVYNEKIEILSINELINKFNKI